LQLIKIKGVNLNHLLNFKFGFKRLFFKSPRRSEWANAGDDSDERDNAADKSGNRLLIWIEGKE